MKYKVIIEYIERDEYITNEESIADVIKGAENFARCGQIKSLNIVLVEDEK